MFINFPELSLTEWHPFSVSSGPGEDHIELHIRALGDHTREIVALAKQCAIENRQTWIRSDGPYGYLGFNYRRYGVLFLVGGGIGVTPVVSLLKVRVLSSATGPISLHSPVASLMWRTSHAFCLFWRGT